MLMTTARQAALATLDRGSGHPYVSLVTVALDGSGAPLMLLSRLARHTQNLEADPRASLLYQASTLSPSDPKAPGNPLAQARVTVLGTAQSTASPTAKSRFLKANPDAQVFANFPDFRFFTLAPATAHFIGGFGRIIEISGVELLAALAIDD